MKSIHVVILALIALAAGAASYFAVRQRSGGATTSARGEALFAGLGEQLGDVTRVELSRGAQRVEIGRADGASGWIVASRDGYPALEEPVRTLVRALADAEIIEKKTASPDLYAKIGVDDPSVEGAKSFLVVLKGRDGATIAGAVIGNKLETANWDFSKTGTFVRRADESQSYLVRATFNPQLEAKDWLDKSLVEMDQGSLRRVVLQHPPASGTGEGTSVTIERPSRSVQEPTLVQMPAGRELADPTAHQRVLHAPATLTLDDVKKSEGFDMSGAVLATWTTFDGLVLTSACVQRDGGYWAMLDAAYQPENALAREENDPKAPENEAEQLRLRADQLSAKFKGWVFRLPEFTGKSMTTTLESLLKPLVPVSPSPQPAPMESPSGVPFEIPQPQSVAPGGG
jgi:hypothetical protein